MNSILLIISITLMYSAPLILAALGGVISERSGVVNIGLEGLMTIGAFFAVLVAFYTGNPILGLIAAGVAGGTLAIIHAVACVTFKADQTISGVAINFIGPGVALFLCRIFFGGAVNTPPVPNKMPTLLGFTGYHGNSALFNAANLDLTVILAFALTFVMWFFLYKTKWGLRVISVGEHPAAADTLGVNVYLTRYLCVIASGVLAGFGGASCSLAIISSFGPTVIAGRGFIALSAVIFGKWSPQGALLACLLFGFAQALVVFLGSTSIPIPAEVISMLPYVLTIVVLVLFVGKSVAPAEDGVPYEKGRR